MDLFEGPPEIDLNNIVLYKLKTKEYFNRLKSLIWIFIEVMATLLVLGIIWITVDWVKIVVTGTAIAMAFILFLILFYVF